MEMEENNAQFYYYPYDELRDGISLLHKFLTNPGLTLPELTVCRNDPVRPFETYDGIGDMTEEEFYKKILPHKFDALLCVAATDKADTRRVSLLLVKEEHAIILSFPSANGELNDIEKQIVQMLSE